MSNPLRRARSLRYPLSSQFDRNYRRHKAAWGKPTGVEQFARFPRERWGWRKKKVWLGRGGIGALRTTTVRWGRSWRGLCNVWMVCVRAHLANARLVKGNNRCELLFRSRNSGSAIGRARGRTAGQSPGQTPYNFLETNASPASRRRGGPAGGGDFFCAPGYNRYSERESH